MTDLNITKTDTSLEVSLEGNGNFRFEGKSYSEDTLGFYTPIIKWITEYFNGNEKSDTVINFNIMYFNSGSSKILFDIFDIFEENKNKSNISINWLYHKDDESSQEDGEDFKDSFPNLKINLVEGSE